MIGAFKVFKKLNFTWAFFALVFIAAMLMLSFSSQLRNTLFEAFSKDTAQKTLIVGRSSDALGLDPSVATDYETFQVTVNIYETLVRFNDSGTDLMPGLAESWEASEDGMKWVFKLRKNVQFHDGTLLDAKAVAFNFNRWMDMDSPYHAGHFSYWSYSFGGFPGIVTSVTALSDYSLEIILNEPFSPFLNILTLPAFGIASPDAIIKYNEALKYNPVGTGPFKFKSWETNKEIVLERNDFYWGQNAKISELIFRKLPTSSDKVAMLTSGEVHIIDSLSPSDINEVKMTSGLKLHYRPYFNIGYLALNNQVEPFDNSLVRKAISHLIDKNQLIDVALNELTRPANTFLPPVLMGYHEGIPSPEHDIDLAKALLKEAGYPDGFKTTLWVMDQPRSYLSNPVGTAKFIQTALSDANIEVDLKIISWDRYLESIKLGEHPMALVGWNGDIIDPDNFLNTFFSSETANSELTLNYSFYSNDYVDRLLAQARTLNDAEFRISLYREIQEIISEDTVSIPLVHSMTSIGMTDAVLNFSPNIIGMESYQKVDLHERKPQE